MWPSRVGSERSWAMRNFAALSGALDGLAPGQNRSNVTARFSSLGTCGGQRSVVEARAFTLTIPDARLIVNSMERVPHDTVLGHHSRPICAPLGRSAADVARTTDNALHRADMSTQGP